MRTNRFKNRLEIADVTNGLAERRYSFESLATVIDGTFLRAFGQSFQPSVLALGTRGEWVDPCNARADLRTLTGLKSFAYLEYPLA